MKRREDEAEPDAVEDTQGAAGGVGSFLLLGWRRAFLFENAKGAEHAEIVEIDKLIGKINEEIFKENR